MVTRTTPNLGHGKFNNPEAFYVPPLPVASSPVVRTAFSDIVSICTTFELLPAPGEPFHDDQALQPVFADIAEIVAIDAEQPPDDEPGLDLVGDEALGPIYADGPEIVAIDAQDDFEPEPGIDFVSDGTPDAVYSDTAEIITLDAEQEIVDEPGVELFIDRLVDDVTVADVSEQIFVVEALELDPDEYDVGLFFDEAIQPVFADVAEIGVLDTDELDAPDYDAGTFFDEAIAPVFADIAEIGALDAEQEIVDEPGLDLVIDRLLDFTAQPDVSEQIFTVDADQPPDDEYDVGLFYDEAIQAIFPDQGGIVNVEAADDFEPEIGLDLVRDEAIQPVFASTVEIVLVDAEQPPDDEPGLEFFSPEAIQPVFASIVEITSLEAADDFEVEVGLDLIQDGALTAVFGNVFNLSVIETVIASDALDAMRSLSASLSESAQAQDVVDPGIRVQRDVVRGHYRDQRRGSHRFPWQKIPPRTD